MTPSRPPHALALVGVSDEYALWDAAYVLGSLSSADRREFEAHMSACPSCRESVSELSAMPALLALLDRDDVAGIDHGEWAAPPPLSPLLLTSLLAKVGRRRGRSGLVAWTVAAAAAAVLAIGVLVGVQSHPGDQVAMPAQTTATALTMAPGTASTTLAATVTITSHGGGTRIEMTCSYGKAPGTSEHDGVDTGDKLAMVVVGHDGSQNRLTTWVALPGVTATPSGSTSMPIDHIAAVQIVSADDGSVLLQRSL
ncbi:MAG: hypothetical protein QOH57_1973 [Mycobacterium sp.]|jgi:hypothetical protein|nr:hypothetical protein [Mycobacterium sp.]